MRIKIFGLALVALLAFGASSASAAKPGTWKVGGAEVLSAKPFYASGTIEIQENYYGNTFKCPFVQEGAVGPGAAGEITGKKVFNCTTGNRAPCNGSVELEAVNLPWKTELVTVAGLLRDKIKNGGSGTPQWMLKCKGSSGETYNSYCTGAETSLGVRGYSEGVKATFDNESAHGTCERGVETLVFSGSGA